MMLLVTDYSTHSGLFPIIYKGSPPFIFKLKIRARVFILGGFWTSGYGLAK